jgi:hypothetical protein
MLEYHVKTYGKLLDESLNFERHTDKITDDHM